MDSTWHSGFERGEEARTQRKAHEIYKAFTSRGRNGRLRSVYRSNAFEALGEIDRPIADYKKAMAINPQ